MCAFRNVHTTSDNHDINYIGINHKTAEDLDEGSDVDFFFLWKGQHLPVTTPATNIAWLLPVYLAMFTMSRRDLKRVNRPSVAMLTLSAKKCEAR